MGKTADLTVVQKTLIDNIHKEGEATRSLLKGLVLCRVLYQQHILGMLTGSERKRCTRRRNDCVLERIAKQSQFKNLGQLHNGWTEAEVNASGATTHCCLFTVSSPESMQ